jgi:hypothetical protein
MALDDKIVKIVLDERDLPALPSVRPWIATLG